MKREVVRLRLLTALSCVLAVQLQSQTVSPAFASRNDVPEIISFFAPLIFPKIIQDGFRLKEYVRSEEFSEFKKEYGDVYSVDAIFDEAMRLSWNNAYEALLISLFATMDHNRFGVQVPIAGPVLWIPLTSELEDDYRKRLNALPVKIYGDTPEGGDRDKLQHFFGSAFLTYLFESREVADRIGEFIEWGEDNVIVDGVLDERDFRANRQGQEFGLRLLDERTVFPSPFFQFSLAKHDSGSIVPTNESQSTEPEKK